MHYECIFNSHFVKKCTDYGDTGAGQTKLGKSLWKKRLAATKEDAMHCIKCRKLI